MPPLVPQNSFTSPSSNDIKGLTSSSNLLVVQARMTRLKSLGVETGIGAEQRPSYVPLPPWQQQSH
eukprot:scaffold186765_cov16-Tisochrysis_lutea.AAC.1